MYMFSSVSSEHKESTYLDIPADRTENFLIYNKYRSERPIFFAAGDKYTQSHEKSLCL